MSNKPFAQINRRRRQGNIFPVESQQFGEAHVLCLSLDYAALFVILLDGDIRIGINTQIRNSHDNRVRSSAMSATICLAF